MTAKKSGLFGLLFVLLSVAGAAQAPLIAGDIILLTSTGLTHVRGGTATPVVPVPIDGNPLPTNWLDGSVEWINGTQFVAAGSDLAPFGLFLLDFTSSITSPSSVRLGVGVGGIRDLEYIPSVQELLVLQNIPQQAGRIDRILGPIGITSVFNQATPFCTATQPTQADYLCALSPTQVLYGGVANTYSVNQGSTTAGTGVALGPGNIYYSMEAIDFDSTNNRAFMGMFNPDYVRRLDYFGGTSFTDIGPVIQLPECDGPEDVEYDLATNTVWCVARNAGSVLGVPWGVQTGNDNALIGATLDPLGNVTGYTSAGPINGHGNTGLFANIAVVGVSPASVSFTGTGCVGVSAVPFALGNIGLPQIGSSTFQVVLSGGQPFAFTYIFLAGGMAATPFPLGSCNVYLDLPTLLAFISLGASPIGPLPLDGTGGLAFVAAIPNNPSLQGQSLALQAAANDSLVGTATTNGMTLNFGP